MTLKQSIDDFNSALLEFIKDLIGAFPSIEAFRRAYASTNLLKTMSPNMPQSLFHQHVYKYADRIRSRDETFFLEHDYNDDVTTDKIEIVGILKTMWAELRDDNKDAVWCHMDNLLSLDEDIACSKQSLNRDVRDSVSLTH